MISPEETMLRKLCPRRHEIIIEVELKRQKSSVRSETEKAVMNMMKQKQSLKFRNLRTAILCLCAWYGFMVTSNAQWTMDTKKESQSQESKSDLKSMIQAPVSNVPALEGPVDPEKYYVGPSDILSVNIWTSPPLNLSLNITPEGTLIIPTVGEVRITDLTLAEAKKKIIDEIKKKYLTGTPSVTLLCPRQITVTVTGAVRYPGKYIVYATDRVDNAIALANKKPKDVIPDTKEINVGQEIRKDIATQFDERSQTKRNIRVTRHTGEITRADILQYYSTRDDRWNPFLREGDEVFVPRIDPKKNVFGVYGGVNVQGTFELAEGDNFLSAIGLAYGFTSRAITDSIVVYRYNTDPEQQVSTIFSFNQVKRDTQKNFPLIPGDRIIVKEQPDIREDYHVFIEGEVRNPGTYPITKGTTKLSQVIAWAGGFTEYASLNAAQLIHNPLPITEQQFDRIRSLRGGGIPEDTTYYSIESSLRTNYQEVSMNFTDLFGKKDTTKDVILQNGDWIRIPTMQKTVYVFGQVILPGNVPFMKNEGYKYYIRRAGGYTNNARSGDVMIIKRASRQWLSPSETEIEEGDYIWVPKEPERSSMYYWTIIGQMASVISVAVSIVIISIQLKK
jgi:protein involved in polysaccharide export with SLBB domain